MEEEEEMEEAKAEKAGARGAARGKEAVAAGRAAAAKIEKPLGVAGVPTPRRCCD